MVDTSNNSREMDDKNLHFYFSNIGPTRRTWLWRLKVKQTFVYSSSESRAFQTSLQTLESLIPFFA